MEDVVYSFSSAGRMGEWHEGNRYDIRTAILAVDPYPNDFKTKVEVRDRVTGKIKQYSGRGSLLAIFHLFGLDLVERVCN